MPVIVLCFDALSLRLLGCYGNPDAKTPIIDALAARSTVFDQCFATDVREDNHPLRDHLQDSPDINTATVEFGAWDSIGTVAEPTVLWCDVNVVVEDELDLATVAAGVSELDAQLAELMDGDLGQPSLFILTAQRGQAFHDAPHEWSELSEERVHLPLIIHAEDCAPGRCGELVQPQDLIPTVDDWLGVPPSEQSSARSLLPIMRGETALDREEVVTRSANMRAVRTAEFHLIESRKNAHEPRRWLFSKPDDRWDTLDVASQDPELTAAYAERFARVT